MYNRIGLALLTMFAAVPAFAVIDVSAVEDALETAAAPVATIGAAMLVAIVGVKVFKLIRRAL